MKTVTEIYIVNMALENVKGFAPKSVIGYVSDNKYTINKKRDIHVFVINVDNNTYEKIRKTFNAMITNPGLPNDLVCGLKCMLRAMIANTGDYGLTFYPIREGYIDERDGNDRKIAIPIDTTIRPCEVVETLYNIEGNDSVALYYHSEQLYSDNMWRGATFDTDKCHDCVFMFHRHPLN